MTPTKITAGARAQEKQREKGIKEERKGGCFKESLKHTYTHCMQTRGPSLALTVSSVMSSRCAAAEGWGRGWVGEGEAGGGLVMCSGVERRCPRGRCQHWWSGWSGPGGEGRGVRGRCRVKKKKRSSHLESLQVRPGTGRERWDRAPGRGEGRQGSDTGHTTVRDQENNQQQEIKKGIHSEFTHINKTPEQPKTQEKFNKSQNHSAHQEKQNSRGRNNLYGRRLVPWKKRISLRATSETFFVFVFLRKLLFNLFWLYQRFTFFPQTSILTSGIQRWNWTPTLVTQYGH